jgi:hypothetical protein
MWIATSGGKTALGPAARRVGEPVQPLDEEALGPVANHGPLHANRLRCCGLGRASCQQEDDLPPASQSCRNGGRTLPPFQRLTLLGREENVQ